MLIPLLRSILPFGFLKIAIKRLPSPFRPLVDVLGTLIKLLVPRKRLDFHLIEPAEVLSSIVIPEVVVMLGFGPVATEIPLFMSSI